MSVLHMCKGYTEAHNCLATQKGKACMGDEYQERSKIVSCGNVLWIQWKAEFHSTTLFVRNIKAPSGWYMQLLN
jgi:hypothetical protein